MKKHFLKYIFVLLIFSFAQNSTSQTFTDSNLPIVVINTDINPISGQPVEIVDDPRVPAQMKIIQRPDGTRNYMTDINTAAFLNYNGRINIEFRGSSSQFLPKKPYGLSTKQADNITNNNVSLLGMPIENDWILNALAFDPSYIRDYISYNLSNQLGNYASRTVYCEVVINGDYKGLYMLQEKLKDDRNRINILDIQSTDVSGINLTGGYITKADKTTGGDPIAWQMSTHLGGWVDYIHEVPKPEDVLPSQTTYIQNQFLNLQIKANNASILNGYPSIIDVPSFVDFILMNELSSNADAYQFSTYFHKDRAGKLRAGPIWDMNLTYGNDLFLWGFDRSKTDVWQFDDGGNIGSKFWKDLFNNTLFKCYLSRRWFQLNQVGKPFSTVQINQLIDTTITLITEAAQRDSQKWFSTDANLGPRVIEIKNFLTERKAWMFTNLGSFSACNNVQVPSLVISKIHYNPMAINGIFSNDQEFIEITNTGSTLANLSGIYLKELGISYQFPFGSTLLAGQKIYLASNENVFLSQHGIPAFGQFTRNLSNKSQHLVLADAFGNVIDEVQYADDSPWPSSADGDGPYLQLIALNLDNSLASSWEASSVSLSSTDVLIKDKNIVFFPNPVTSILHVKSDFNLTKIEIYDVNGRLLKYFMPTTEVFQIDCSSFQSGFYFIKAYHEDLCKTDKFFKR